MADDEKLVLALSDLAELKVMLRAQVSIVPDVAVIKRDVAGIFAHLAKLNGTVADHSERLQRVDDYHKDVAAPLVPLVLASQQFQTELKLGLRILWVMVGVTTSIIVTTSAALIYHFIVQ